MFINSLFMDTSEVENLVLKKVSKVFKIKTSGNTLLLTLTQLVYVLDAQGLFFFLQILSLECDQFFLAFQIPVLQTCPCLLQT